jgi:Helix-turn-helix domain
MQIEKPPLTDFAASLRLVAEEFAPGSAVPVPRERLLELLSAVLGEQDVTEAYRASRDLRVEDVAREIDRSPSTVRQMCADGEFAMPTPGEGAYKHRGKEWLIPEAALRGYRERERLGGRASGDNISDWKRARRTSTQKRGRKDAA